MSPRCQTPRRGFTLIELLIVITVISILSLIVIPRVMGASRKAQEAALKGNLTQLRNALEQFQGDTSYYPNVLLDLVASSYANLSATTKASVTSGSWHGPYLSPQGGIKGSGIPINPFIPSGDSSLGAGTASATDVSAHWTYTPNGTLSSYTLEPTVPASGNTLDGVPYQSL